MFVKTNSCFIFSNRCCKILILKHGVEGGGKGEKRREESSGELKEGNEGI